MPSASESSPLSRRLQAEWDLLHRLALQNPGRLTRLAAEDLTFSLRLENTPALPLPPQVGVRLTHDVRLVFPTFFPAAPLELSLATPMRHPNIHPATGFVCLWDRHRVSNTVEHALHKLVAILGLRLYNKEAPHVMQPDALSLLEPHDPAVTASLAAEPLHGVVPEFSSSTAPAGPLTPRRRLS